MPSSEGMAVRARAQTQAHAVRLASQISKENARKSRETSWKEKAAKARPGPAHSQRSLQPQQDDRRAGSVIFASLEAGPRRFGPRSGARAGSEQAHSWAPA